MPTGGAAIFGFSSVAFGLRHEPDEKLGGEKDYEIVRRYERNGVAYGYIAHLAFDKRYIRERVVRRLSLGPKPARGGASASANG